MGLDSLSFTFQTMSSIKRIGIVLKPHQPDALKTICDLTLWLSQKGIELVGGPEIERERVEHETGCSVSGVETEKLAESVDLILVLGGDGTMIASARMLSTREKVRGLMNLPLLSSAIGRSPLRTSSNCGPTMSVGFSSWAPRWIGAPFTGTAGPRNLGR